MTTPLKTTVLSAKSGLDAFDYLADILIESLEVDRVSTAHLYEYDDKRTPKQRKSANAATELILAKVKNENYQVTEADKAVLAKYSGQGGATIDNALDMIVEAKKAITKVDKVFIQRLNDINDKIKELNVLINVAQRSGNSDESRRLFQIYESLRDEFKSISNERKETLKDPEKAAKLLGDGITDLRKKGSEAIGKLLESSPISKQQADEWVSRQKTPKNVYAALAKKGYPTDKIKADMAEFYQLTHGKLKDVEIVLGGAKRANAKNVSSLLFGGIDLGSNPAKGVLFHEMAHHLEADYSALELARGFLVKRRKSEKEVSLKKLTGSTGYSSDERAYEDDFITHYVGKVYDDATEVFSMGMEYLSSPEKFIELVAFDSEHAALILQYISNESELLNATKKLTSTIFDDISDSNKKKVDSFQDEIKRVANGIDLYNAGFSASNLSDNQKYKITYYLSVKNAYIPEIKYIGSYKRDNLELHIVEGKFSKQSNGRIAKGYAVIYERTEKVNYGTETQLTAEAMSIHRPLDEVKAVIAYMFKYYPYGAGKVDKLMWLIRRADRDLNEQSLDKLKDVE